jgi:hypothetical protein
LSTQVFEHLPSADLRASFLSNVADSLRPNGRFVVSAYHQNLKRKLRGLAPDGSHSSGVPFHYFSATELKREVECWFDVERLRFIDISLPFEAALGVSQHWRAKLSRTLELVPGTNAFAHLIVISGRSREHGTP